MVKFKLRTITQKILAQKYSGNGAWTELISLMNFNSGFKHTNKPSNIVIISVYSGNSLENLIGGLIIENKRKVEVMSIILDHLAGATPVDPVGSLQKISTSDGKLNRANE